MYKGLIRSRELGHRCIGGIREQRCVIKEQVERK
jgi:hypothetical protein